MATTETQVKTEADPTSSPSEVVQGGKSISTGIVWLIDQLLRLLSSVRFGIIMLSMLLICSMIGMLIMQKDVEGFDQYFAKLTPAQRLIYTKLNIFDIYHSRYFTFLLAITALNIILASIDRFPTAWQYIVKPKLSASPKFIQAQMFNAEMTSREKADVLASRIAGVWQKHKEIQSSINVARFAVIGLFFVFFGFCYILLEHTIAFWIVSAIVFALVLAFILIGLRFDVRVLEDKGKQIVFAQLNAWNRLGAYFVHVALMLIFIGGFLTNWYGVGGNMEILPGETSDSFIKMETTLEGPKLERVKLPFTLECTDLQQKLIRPEGGLEATNTIDWLSFVTIKDGATTLPALVHLNNPYDYRGFRLFQSKFTAFGHARSITVRFEPVGNGKPVEATIPRNGEVEVPGIGKVSYKDFYPDFEMSGNAPHSASGDYNNPAAQLEIVASDGKPRGAFAFTREFADKLLTAEEDKNQKGTDKSKNDSKTEGSKNQKAAGKSQPPQDKPATPHAEPKNDNDILLVNGYKPILVGFEKAAMGHTLTLQYDPGRTPAYLGFIMLVISLCSVFFFAHQRLWAVIEPTEKGSTVYFGGNTNRNRPAFEGRFNSIVDSVNESKK